MTLGSIMCSARFLDLVPVQILSTNNSDETLRNSFGSADFVSLQPISGESGNFWRTL